MSFWTAIIVLAAIGAAYSLKRNRDQARYGGHYRTGWQQGEDLPSAHGAEMQREIEELRERVKVLERIATEDRGARAIADEIESLRGK